MYSTNWLLATTLPYDLNVFQFVIFNISFRMKSPIVDTNKLISLEIHC